MDYPYYDENMNTVYTGDVSENVRGSSNVEDDVTNFFSIVPRDNNLNVISKKPIPLKVISDGGVEVNPDISFKSTRLNSYYNTFQNNTGYNDSFNITVLLDSKETIELLYNRYDENGKEKNWDIFEKELVKSWEGSRDVLGETETYVPVHIALNYWIRRGVQFYIYTRAVGINKKDLYIITEQKKRTQNYDDGLVEWDLTFTRYKEITKSVFKKSTSVITKALKKLKESKLSAKQKARIALAKCNYKKIVYSKKEKKVKCVKAMQQVLYLQKFLTKKQVDGWYGKTTKKAVKAYQKKWSKDYGLKVTGNCNKHTWKVMCGKGKKLTTSTKNTIVNVNAKTSIGNDGLSIVSSNPVVVKKVSSKKIVKANTGSNLITGKPKLTKATKVSTKNSKKKKKSKK